MSWLDRLLGKPKTPSTTDPVGPIGGSMQPVRFDEPAPYIHPGNPGGTYAPAPGDTPSIEYQQSPLNAQGLLPTEGQNPAYMDLQQQTLWPHEIPYVTPAVTTPFHGRGPDPKWTPTDFNPGPEEARHPREYRGFNRPWRLTPRLDGNRTFFESSDRPVPSSEGYVGLRQPPRASMFTEPAPWSTNVIDTTAASGTPNSPGNATTPVSINVSSPGFPATNNRSYRLGS